METLTKLLLVLLPIVQGADPLSDFYQLAWPDEGTCDYTCYQTPSEYVLHTAFIYSLEDCASMCIATDHCTGFESRQTLGTFAQPHCLIGCAVLVPTRRHLTLPARRTTHQRMFDTQTVPLGHHHHRRHLHRPASDYL